MNVSQNPNDSLAPVVTITSSGFDLFWIDSSPGNWEVFYRHGYRGEPDIELLSYEVIQAADRPTQLVAGKPTRFRAKIVNHYDQAQLVQAQIYISDGSGSRILAKDVYLKPGLNELYLPEAETSIATFIRLAAGPFLSYSLILGAGPGETNLENNTIPIASLPIADTRPLRVLYVPLATSVTPAPSCPDVTRLANASRAYTEGIYPIDDLESSFVVTCVPWAVSDPLTRTVGTGSSAKITLRDEVLQSLANLRLVGGYDKVVGVVGGNFFKSIGMMNALGVGPLNGASSVVSVNTVCGVAAAHEMAHNYNLVPNTLPGSNGNSHYAEGKYAPGYDVVRNRRHVTDEDFMLPTLRCSIGKDDNRWISTDSFDFLISESILAPVATTLRVTGLTPTTLGTKVVALNGSVDDQDHAQLKPAYLLDGKAELPMNHPGEYRLAYLDEIGNLLGETGFDLSFYASPDSDAGYQGDASFSYFFPQVLGAKRLSLRHGIQILAELPISAASPQVTLTLPNGGETFHAGDPITITWSASDLDGDVLTFLVSMSKDGGTTWTPVAADVVGNSFEINAPEGVRSSQVLFKVTATDGYNTAEDTSNAFLSLLPASGGQGCYTLEKPYNFGSGSPATRITVEGSHVYVLWSENITTTWSEKYIVSHDAGKTFSTARTLYVQSTVHMDDLWMRASGNRVYFFYKSDLTSEPYIYFRLSEDYGETFGPATQFNYGGATPRGLEPQWVAVDGSKIYLFVWDVSNQSFLFYKSEDGGSTFSSPQVVVTATGDPWGLNFLVQGDHLVLSWADTSDNSLWFRESLDGGLTWSTPEPIGYAHLDYLEYDDYPQEFVLIGGQAHIVWMDNLSPAGTPNYLYMRSRRPDGSGFYDPVVIDQSSGETILRLHVAVPRIAGAGNDLYVIWRRTNLDATPDEIYVRASHDGGQTYDLPIQITEGMDGQRHVTPRLLSDGQNVYIAWGAVKTVGIFDQLYVSTSVDYGDTFTSPTLLPEPRPVDLVYNGEYGIRFRMSGGSPLLFWYAADTDSPDERLLIARGNLCGASGETVEPSPVPPQFDALNLPPVFEGTTTVITLTATDQNYDALSFSAQNLPQFANLTDFGVGQARLELSPFFGQAGVYTGSQVVVTDGSFWVTRTFTVTVNIGNRPPVIDLPSQFTAYEGQPFSLDGSGAYDPEKAALSYRWMFNGNLYNQAKVDLNLTDDANFNATLTVTDEVGSAELAFTRVLVQNLPAEIQAIPEQTSMAGRSLRLTGISFQDMGVEDTHVATIDWGDGTGVEPLLVTETGGSGTLSGEHIYANPGVYELTITLLDDDGGVTVKKGQVLVYQLLYLPLVIKG